MCDRRVWEPVWRALGMDFPRAYIPLETARTAAEFRYLIDKEADAAGDEGLNLVAFSMGGYLAMEYTLNHPERVRSLVTISSSAFGLHEAEKKQRRSAVEYLKTHEYGGITDVRIKQMLHEDRHSDKSIRQIMRDMDRDLGTDTLITQLSETSERENLMPRLEGISCPVLLIGGDSDPFLTPEQLQEMADAIPDSKSVSARCCGHMLPLERTTWLASQLRSFYSRKDLKIKVCRQFSYVNK